MKCATNLIDGGVEVAANLEVPQPDDNPAERPKLRIDTAVPLDVGFNLLVPVGSRAAGAMARRMSMPEGAVDEYGHPSPGPGEVGTARRVPVVAPPPARAGSVKRLAQGEFRAGVLPSDSRHDPASLFGSAGVGHLSAHDAMNGHVFARGRLRPRPHGDRQRTTAPV